MLQNPSSTLQVLNLEGNNLGNTAVSLILESSLDNYNLKSLNLSKT